MMNKEITNYGSALGEAIGAEMEKSLNIFLSDLVENRGFHFISKSPIKGKKKLLMYDKFGTPYNIDSVIANESMQPIILVESKYIRYKKHNRDKGSWVCTAHPALRKRYASIRSSIAILADSWSSSSVAMMKSYDINVFLIPFRRICELLAKHQIEFDWGEKDRNASQIAWERYSALTDAQRTNIGVEMINLIKADLQTLILSILDDQAERQVRTVSLEVHSNLGEVRAYEFATISEAVDFLNNTELKDMFIISDSLTLFDLPPNLEQ
jgi:hypothetical protein